MSGAPVPALTRLRRHLLRRERLGVFETPPESVAGWSGPAVPGVVLRPAGRPDAARMGDLLGAADAARRLARGDLAMVAEADGRIVGCTWLTQRPIWAPHYRIPVRPSPLQGYVHGLAVLESHRRRGIGVGLFRAVRLEARRRGVAHTMSHVQLANRPALAVQAAGGGRMRTRLYAIVLADALGVVLSARRAPDAPPVPLWMTRRARLRRLRRAMVRRVRYDLLHTPTALVDDWRGSPPPGVEVARVTRAHVLAMRATFPAYMVRTFDYLLSGPLGPDGIRAGHRGVVALRGGEPIGCALACSVPLTLRHLAIRVEPGPDEWYTYGVHILSEHTGSVATGRAVMGALLADARAAGMRVLTGHVDLANRFNKVMRRMGAVGRERTYTIVLLNRQAIPVRRWPLDE